MQFSPNKPLSKMKEEEKHERARRYDLIRRAREGDAEAVSELRRKHRITKVWTQEEINTHKDAA